MQRLTEELKKRFDDYVEEVGKVAEHLSFVLDNVNESFELDFSVQSLVALEQLFWKFQRNGVPGDFIAVDHLAHLLGQYLGACVVHSTGAKWVQCTDHNGLFGQPCLDGFGNKPWERVYPVNLSVNLHEIEHTQPDFPGVSEHQVLATALANAIKVKDRESRRV